MRPRPKSMSLTPLLTYATEGLVVGNSALPKVPYRATTSMCRRAVASNIEEALLDLLPSTSRRVDELVSELVSLGGVAHPFSSALIEGDWKLIHSSSSKFDMRNPLGRRVDGSTPGLEGVIGAITGGASEDEASSSPIQRAAIRAFEVVQSIRLSSPEPRVLQQLRTPVGVLHLNARASVAAATPQRIDFAFDEGYLALTFPAGLRLPYPVPFRRPEACLLHFMLQP